MKPTLIEEAFINVLTRCAWWFDYKYNKSVVWLVVACTSVISYITVVLFGIDSYSQTISYAISFKIWFFIFIFLLPVVITVMMLLVLVAYLFVSSPYYTRKQILQNTKKSPNPNKYTHWIVTCRLSVIFPIFFGALRSSEGASFLISIFMIVAITPSLYLLCVNPIPPGLKKKMLEENELGKLEPVTSL